MGASTRGRIDCRALCSQVIVARDCYELCKSRGFVAAEFWSDTQLQVQIPGPRYFRHAVTVAQLFAVLLCVFNRGVLEDCRKVQCFTPLEVIGVGHGNLRRMYVGIINVT